MSRKKRQSGAQKPVRTGDGYNNFAAKLGGYTANIQSGGSYQPGYISRNRVQLEFAYRSSFLVGAGVDAMADDMTRKGINISSKLESGQKGKFETFWDDIAIWDGLNDTLKWSRLYGGALLVVLLEGQDMSTPLKLDRIKEGQFKGVMCLDRWMVSPTYYDLVSDYGPEFGKPKFYKVVTNQQGIPPWKIHHSRIIRMEGDTLPFQQAQTENGWGMSVVERIFERIQAFDTATVGTTQLIHKAHLRTYSIEGLRKILATGGTLEDGLMKHMDMIREFQTIEGMTIMDASDTFQTHSYSFAGNVAEQCGATWQFVDGQRQMVAKNEYVHDAIVLNSATGLIGMPQQTIGNGVNVRALINPNIRVNGLIQLDQASVFRTALSNNDIAIAGGQITDQNSDGNITLSGTTVQPASIATDGVYIVRGIMYTGDTRGQAWYMDMMCEARGAADLLSSSAQQRIYS